MKAAVVHAYGFPPSYDDFPDPAAAEGEEIVTVRAAGIHPLVRSLAAGEHYAGAGALPMIPGVDGVAQTAGGARVYFGGVRAPFGTMAERAPASKLAFTLPAALGDARAAAIVNPGMSSWLALKARAALREGETVLVLGATGIAGGLALQIAKKLGAGRIVAAGRDREILRRLPADAHVELGRSDVAARIAEAAGGGVDVVLDYVWGEPAETVLEAVTVMKPRRTRYVQIGAAAGDVVRLPSQVMRKSGIEILGSGLGSIPMATIGSELPRFLEIAPELEVEWEEVPLFDVTRVWNRRSGAKRVVLVPSS